MKLSLYLITVRNDSAFLLFLRRMQYALPSAHWEGWAFKPSFAVCL